MKKWALALMGMAAGITLATTQSQSVDAATEQAFHGTGWVRYVPNYGIELWQSPDAPQQSTGRKLAHGTSWKISAAAKVGDHYWYKLGTNQWMDGNYISLSAVAKNRATDLKANQNVIRAVGNAAIYNAPNGTATGKTLPNGTSWKFSDESVAGDHMWFQVGANQWVKDTSAQQVVTYKAAPVQKPVQKPAATTPDGTVKPMKATGWVAYVPGYGIELWENPGQGATGRKLAHGTSWKISGAVRDGNHYWYKLGTNQWMDGRYISLSPVAKDRKVDQSINRNVVRISGTAPVYATPNGKATGKKLPNRSTWTFSDRSVAGSHMWFQVGKGQWVKDSWAKEAVPYQNPSQFYQVSYKQIKPVGKVGYNLVRGSEGIKTWLVLRALGLNSGYANMTASAQYAVANFQRRHGLPATGIVDKATWVKLGFKASTWTSIDSWIYPLKAHWYDDRAAHIEAMIKAAYSYMGKPYIVGASTSTQYGTDCSGLVTQALYAAGISPLPVSSIQHAQPGNEWNSRLMAATRKFKHVSYAQRQRGDLIFYTSPYDGRVWHVAIYLGNNMVIESWPPRIMVQPIKNSQRSWVTGVARPFV